MIIILNGPPGSGKDSLGTFCLRQVAQFDLHPLIKLEKFAKALKDANQALFGIGDIYDSKSIEYQWENDLAQKNAKRPELAGFSWREVNIALSEEFVKGKYGKDFFGVSLVNRIKRDSWNKGLNHIITDGGFDEEVGPLVKEFGVDNVAVIKLHKSDCSYAQFNDSRKYIDCEKLGIKEYHLDNTPGELDKYLQDGDKLIVDIINKK